MLGRTHLAIGILCALLVLPFISVPSKLLFVILVAFGALLPDVDHEKSKINRLCPVTKIIPVFFKHRGFFHSLFVPALIYGVFWYFNEQFVGLSLVFGYLTHLVSDGMTRMGVNFLHPLSNWQMRGPFETGTFAETLLFVGVIAGIVVKLVF
ncbi:metal-dependent hydrolase [Candidatus Woesearchaeota archaeon]|nr:metal-dependent hydrolase [Candidatus Woesearchaeota archaeon]